MKIRVINDIHIGARRKSGTTPQSQVALRHHILQQFDKLLDVWDTHAIIAGDLFDDFTVEAADLIGCYNALSVFLRGTGTSLTLLMGNHDSSPRGVEKVSSFHTLAHFLKVSFPNQVEIIDAGFARVSENVFAIPHMPNQDLFDMEIEKAIVATGGILILHCNIVNNFAEHSDHTLNLSETQMDRLIAAGWTILSGHEHQYSTRRASKVIVPGNQIPTSVADCLNCDGKYFAEIDGGTIKVVKLSDNPLVEIDWTEDALPVAPFIRVTGEASAEQAADVVGKIAAWRKASDAFVIGNAVKIAGCADFEELAEASFDEVKKIDVLTLLLDELSPEEATVVKELLQ